MINMATGKSIRIYDLAREVKQDTKRVMEDLRREGADVSVASNSVPFELAEKIRNKYVPKAEAPPKRAIKVIKAAKVAETAPPPPEPPAEEIVLPVEPVAPAEAKPVEVPTVEEAAEPAAGRKVKKLTAKPAIAPVVEEAPPVKRIAKSKVEAAAE